MIFRFLWSMIFRFFAVRQERRRLRRHNFPVLVSRQVGKGGFKGRRQAGTDAIRERREQSEAQVAPTYSIVLAVLAH